MVSSKEQKDRVSRAYAEKLEEPASCCEGACGEGIYPLELLTGLPEEVKSFGCGNPVALASLEPGQVVLDLGSGAGLDCFLAAKAVGSEGRVIGVDFTPTMIQRAQENAAKLDLGNVSFRMGDIEAIPVEDASVDVVISNCVINLAPDKDAVFREAFRVLRFGGRLMVSDIVLTRPASDEEMEDFKLYTECISGSLPVEEYMGKVRSAGFSYVRYEVEHPVGEGHFWFSAAVLATKE
jgi:ubiquinone/menaquinone biosynthesis C-methylase UbiE